MSKEMQKLIYTLKGSNVIELSSDDYNTLMNFFSEDEEKGHEDIAKFGALMERLAVHPADVLVHENLLNDRGRNDYYQLKLFEKLQQNGVNIREGLETAVSSVGAAPEPPRFRR